MALHARELLLDLYGWNVKVVGHQARELVHPLIPVTSSKSEHRDAARVAIRKREAKKEAVVVFIGFCRHRNAQRNVQDVCVLVVLQ